MARMGSRRAILLATVAAFGLTSLTSVQAQDEEPLSWYAIEVIVFERTGDGGLGAEAWPADPGLPALADALELSADGLALEELESGSRPEADVGEPAATATDVTVSPASEPVPRAPLPRAFRRLPPDEHRLNDAWRSLEKSSAYRPLLHVAWIQPGLPAERARLVHLRNDNAALGTVSRAVAPDGEPAPAMVDTPGGAPTLMPRIEIARDPSRPALDGTLRVHRARYLHVLADLLYYRPVDGHAALPPATGDQAAASPLPDSPDTAFIEQLLAEEDAAPRLFRLTESRRMRSKELHYLDHPLFGVLVQAWPLELPDPPEPAAETPAEGGPAEPATTPPAPAPSATGG